mgnify:CR=1 FL=1
MQNPLIAEILSFIKQYPEGITEYEIIKMLEEKKYFKDLAKEDELALFQKHFITMNALYQLQLSLWENERIYLDITSVRVALSEHTIVDNSCSDTELAETASVRDYYLDWENFENTDQEQVLEMLNSFWQMYFNQDKLAGAYKTLKLEQYESLDVVKRQYRKLVAKYHPDKGGNQCDFISIRQAYEVIRQSACFGNR